jgi:Flp pilus assembly pilin Flp
MPTIVRRVHRHGAQSSALLARFVAHDGGQDLVEYAFLAAFIGIAGWAVIMTVPTAIGDTYQSWIDPSNGVPGLWDPPEPAAAGS